MEESNPMPAPSRFGCASLIVWLAMVVLSIVGFAVFFYLAVLSGRNVNLPGDGTQEAVLTTVGVLVMCVPVIHLTGFVLGVVGLVRREPRKFVAIIGIVLNGLAVLGAFVLGLLSGYAASM